MDIKLFSLCNEESPIADKGKKYIFDCVKNFADDCEGFSHFTSQKRMLLAMSQSLLSAEVIIIAVQGTMYNATKKLLCSALDIRPEQNLLVMEQLTPRLNSGKIKPNAYNSNILFPPNAEILPTDNYMNCGFAISSGNQHIIYMPIDSPNADEVVLGSLYDYLAGISDNDIAQKAIEHRKEAIIYRASEKLSEENVSVAIAENNVREFIAPILRKGNTQSISIEETYSDTLGDNEKNTIVNLARLVRDKSNTQLGAAVSKVLTDEEGNRSAYIAIADSSGTKVEHIFADNYESDKQLISICIDRLMLLLYNYDELGSESEESAFEKKNDTRFKEIIGIAIAGLTLAASVTGFIVALILK